MHTLPYTRIIIFRDRYFLLLSCAYNDTIIVYFITWRIVLIKTFIAKLDICYQLRSLSNLIVDRCRQGRYEFSFDRISLKYRNKKKKSTHACNNLSHIIYLYLWSGFFIFRNMYIKVYDNIIIVAAVASF